MKVWSLFYVFETSTVYVVLTQIPSLKHFRKASRPDNVITATGGKHSLLKGNKLRIVDKGATITCYLIRPNPVVLNPTLLGQFL
jgi:hypothetical protein